MNGWLRVTAMNVRYEAGNSVKPISANAALRVYVTLVIRHPIFNACFGEACLAAQGCKW
jgi:hypothetical protein